MSRRLAALDRVLVLLLAVLLLAAGLLALEWRLRVVSDDYPDQIDVPGLGALAEAAWWPWALAGAGVLLGLLGLVWLFSHLGRRSVPDVGLPQSRADGRLRVDLSTLGEAVAGQLAAAAPLDHVRARPVGTEDHPVLQVRADLAPGARGTDIRDAAEQSAADLRRALPDTDVRLQLLLDAPRRRPLRRSTATRVQ
ncbi:hypothetical protein [uncultured Serinicoccus sp.]|uniref:hypothetical protein n=1 Tax=uncultured Serinicoccus sp. TaxID=735514 RepID=UPI00260310EB|nr:hypothetical protein [uncultured Serinicoccus sp.]